MKVLVTVQRDYVLHFDDDTPWRSIVDGVEANWDIHYRKLAQHVDTSDLVWLVRPATPTAGRPATPTDAARTEAARQLGAVRSPAKTASAARASKLGAAARRKWAPVERKETLA